MTIIGFINVESVVNLLNHICMCVSNKVKIDAQVLPA